MLFQAKNSFLRRSNFFGGRGGIMKLKKPDRNVIVVFEPEDYLYSIVKALLDDDDDLFHAHDAAALQSIVAQEVNGIAFLLAWDETERYDTLEIIDSHRNEPWLQGALSVIVTEADPPGREEKADALGFQDYVKLSGIPSGDHNRILRSSS